MNIKVHSGEMSRMMKTVLQCIDSKHEILGNVAITHDNNMLTIRGGNGAMSAKMSTPILGGDGESFCVDGGMLARVCSLSNDMLDISTDGKTCTIKGAGRTRLPIVDVNVSEYEPVEGNEITISADEFSKMYGGVAYAISQDQSRITLTGVLVETEDDAMRMVSLDGFRLAKEQGKCTSGGMKMVVPGTFMKLLANSTYSGDEIKLTSSGFKVQAETEGMTVSCSLLSGEFPDYKRMLPESFATEVLVSVDLLRNALKSNSVVCNTSNLVKMVIGGNEMKVSGNSEQADYEAELPCSVQGNGLRIAFNQKYLLETIGSVNADSVVMKFNGQTNPCVLNGKDEEGIRLILPVRVMGW